MFMVHTHWSTSMLLIMPVKNYYIYLPFFTKLKAHLSSQACAQQILEWWGGKWQTLRALWESGTDILCTARPWGGLVLYQIGIQRALLSASYSIWHRSHLCKQSDYHSGIWGRKSSAPAWIRDCHLKETHLIMLFLAIKFKIGKTWSCCTCTPN